MILSHRHGFIFVKGAKVAGTSAEIALSQVCGPNDIVTPITPTDEKHRLGTPGEPRNYSNRFLPSAVRSSRERAYLQKLERNGIANFDKIRPPNGPYYNHMTLTEVLRLVPEARSYQVLCVERSPYSKVVSLAVWARHQDDYQCGRSLPEGSSAIAEWVDAIFESGRVKRVLNVNKYRDLEGEVHVSPWKTESLASDLSAYLASRGLPDVPVIRTKEGVKSDRLAPEEVLRPDQIDAINQLFEEEFRLFGWPLISA